MDDVSQNTGDYDMTAAGFDGFMSRSIDSTPELNLDSVVPPNNALPFDRTQITGSQGDTFNMGGISMAAKDNAITLNDGQLIVNDASTNSSINASSGNITYFDSTGNLVVQEGVLDDGATGIRIVDKQQVGIAQFGRFKDGTTALKVAKQNFEVSTATNDQLVFNSAQNVLKVVKILPVSCSVAYSTNATPNGNQTNVATYIHGLGFTPSYIANIIMDDSAASQNGNSSTDNYANPGMLLGWVGSHVTAYVVATVTVDSNNVYFRIMMDTQGFTNGTYTFTATVYLLQEAFTPT